MMIEARLTTWRPWISGTLFVSRLVLGALFVYSGMTKLRRPYDFLENVYSYELTSPTAGTVIAAFVPWFELCLGLCLIVGLFVSAAMLGAVFLGIAFVTIQAHAIRSGLTIACGCFGSNDASTQPINYVTMWRTLAVLSGALIGYGAAILDAGISVNDGATAKTPSPHAELATASAG